MNDYEVAIEVAEAGADVVRRHFGTMLRRLNKGEGDFATNADVEAEHTMLAVLRRERPDDAIVGGKRPKWSSWRRPDLAD